MHWSPPLVGLTTQIIMVTLLVLNTYNRHESIDTPSDQLTDAYDYIVVGSGSAGSVISNRLASDGKTRVLLLEAGGPSTIVNDIPAPVATTSLFSSNFDWNYTYVPQHFGRAYRNGIPENRGFVIGGTSSFNTMIYNRGNRRDYDTWAQKYGAVGWSFKDVLPYFRKYENNQDPKIVGQSPGFHGTSGPVQITSWAKPDPLMLIHQNVLNTEAGVPNTDINGPQQLGTTFAQAFITSRGVRSSASNNYIDPNPFPHNLHILTGSLVTRVLFDGNTAVGVQFERLGANYKVRAIKEVILSGGVYGSPQLLMLSGIGPSEHLHQMHIPVVADLPVGNNWQNHPGMQFNFPLKPESLKLVNIPGTLSPAHLYEWFTAGAGPLASHYRSSTYFNTKSNMDKEWPNANFESTIYRFTENLTSFSQYSYVDQHSWDEWYTKNYLGQFYLFVHTILERPLSRGTVRLASPDPHILPLITSNFLKEPQDYLDNLELVTATLRFYELSSIAKYTLPLPPVPGCQMCPDKRYVFECQSYIRCAIEQTLYSSYHPAGTCRMGAPERHDTVVDPYLRVKGINRLRVCDNSIPPLLPNSNPNAMALMIGERCADIVRGQSGLSQHY